MGVNRLPVVYSLLKERRDSGIVAAILADSKVRYFMVGSVSAGLYFTFFAAGWLALGHAVPYLVLAVMAHVMTAFLVYPIHRVFVFRSGVPWIAGFARFYTVFGSGFAFSMFGLTLLVETLGITPVIAQVIMIAVFPVIGYLVQRYWVFRQGPPPSLPVMEEEKGLVSR